MYKYYVYDEDNIMLRWFPSKAEAYAFAEGQPYTVLRKQGQRKRGYHYALECVGECLF